MDKDIEMIEMKVTVPDEEFEQFTLMCEEAEQEGLLERISITVVRSYTITAEGVE